MFFKNVFVFAFTQTFSLSQEEVETRISENTFTPCGSTELSHFGWVNSLGKYGVSLSHESGGSLFMCARREDKIIPAQVIKDILEERVNLLELEHGRGATKKEKEQFKEDIIFELLPRAFSRLTDTHGYINAEHNIIVINTSSRTKAEDFLALLRKSLGTLPVTSLSPERAPDEVMTDWLNKNSSLEDFALGDKFKLGEEAQLNSLGDDGSVVHVKNMALDINEVKVHLDSDMFVTKVGLEYDDSMSFILNDDLSIKRLKFFDIIHEQNDGIDSDDKFARLDADLTLMSGELNRMITDLFSEFSVSAHDYLDND